MLKSKKGNLLDWFYIIPIIFIISAVSIVCLLMVNKIDDTGVFDSDSYASAAITKTRVSMLNMDNLLFFVLIGLSIFTLVSTYFVWNNPVFFFLALIFLVIAVIVSAMFSNAYEEFKNSSEISETSSLFPKINFIMDKFPLYLAFMFMMTLIVMGISFKNEYG